MTYPWGVPTRSCVEEHGYRRWVRLAAAAERVAAIPGLLSDIPLHNQVNAASHRTNAAWVKAGTLYQNKYLGQLLLRFLPKEFPSFLNPLWLIGHKLDQIQEAFLALEVVKEDLNDEQYLRLKIFLELLKSQLGEVQASYQKSGNSLAAIQLLWKILSQAEASFSSSFGDIRFYSLRINHKLFLLEQESTGEAATLYAQYQAATKGSDVIVRFDETYVDVRKGNGMVCIPLQPMFAQPFFTSSGLTHRVEFRDLVGQRLRTKGELVINGLKLWLIDLVGYEHIICATDSKPSLELVNLLGFSVRSDDSLEVIHPDAWIHQEQSWVRHYRMMTDSEQLQVPPYGWTKFMLEQYKGFQDEYGVPSTDGESVKLLRYALSGSNRFNNFSPV